MVIDTSGFAVFAGAGFAEILDRQRFPNNIISKNVGFIIWYSFLFMIFHVGSFDYASIAYYSFSVSWRMLVINWKFFFKISMYHIFCAYV